MDRQENLRSGERRNVTVVFADMKDFSRLSERLDPEEMDGVMSTVFAAFESIVKRHGGSVEKYIGDALVAVFGVPTLHEDDPTRAVTAAMDFLREVADINRSLDGRDLTLSFRTGINTGLITTGRRGEFEVVTGHTMSVAARLESEAPVNGILVSETTKEGAENDFVFGPRRLLTVKGSSEPVPAYVVKGRNTTPFRDDALFVDRETIVDSLVKRYMRYEGDGVEGALLVGGAGVGKTSIVARLISRLRQFPGFDTAILYARARRYGGVDFSIIADMLANYFQIDVDAGREPVVEALTSRVGIEKKTADEFASLILDKKSGLAENQAFVVLYLVLKSILGRFQSGPYAPIIFLDNASDMDRQSRDFFRFFVKNAERKPFFLLADRKENPLIRDAFPQLATVEVPALDPADARELLRRLWPECQSGEMTESILANSAGNPLFIREYVRYAKATGDKSALPTTIGNIVLALVEGYEEEMRDFLKKMSVFRHSFSLADAKHVQERTDGDPRIVEPAISFFLREGLLVQERDIYLFRHDIVKWALYDSLLNYNKRILHRIVASLMRAQERPNTLRLLHHLVRAGEYEEAFEVIDGARDSHINMEYVRYIDRILGEMPQMSEELRIRLLFGKSALLFNNGNSEDADTILKEVLRTAVIKKNIDYAGVAYHLLTAYNMKGYAFQKAYLCGTKALEYFSRSGSATGRVQNLLHIMALSELFRNDEAESDRLAARMLDLKGVDPDYARRAMAEIHLIKGRYRDAVALIEESIQARGSVEGDPGSVYALACQCYWHLCDFRRLKDAFDHVVADPGHNYSQLSQCYSLAAVACRFCDCEDRVEEFLQQAEFYALQAKNDFDYIDAARSLTVALLILKKVEKAMAMAIDSLTIGLRHSAYYPTFSLLTSLAEMYLNEARPQDAGFYLKEASFYVNLKVRLPRRELILYHYFCGRVEDKPEEIAEAVRLFGQETEALGDPRYVEALTRLRAFGHVAEAAAASIEHVDSGPAPR